METSLGTISLIFSAALRFGGDAIDAAKPILPGSLRCWRTRLARPTRGSGRSGKTVAEQRVFNRLRAAGRWSRLTREEQADAILQIINLDGDAGLGK